MRNKMKLLLELELPDENFAEQTEKLIELVRSSGVPTSVKEIQRHQIGFESFVDDVAYACQEVVSVEVSRKQWENIADHLFGRIDYSDYNDQIVDMVKLDFPELFIAEEGTHEI